MKILLAPLIAVLCLYSFSQDETEPAHDWRELKIDDATTVRYIVHTPPSFEDGQTSPFLLVFPPGDQSEAMTEWVVSYFAEEADRLGYVIAVPMAVNGKSWFSGSEAHLPLLVKQLETDYAIEYGKFHVAGISNGGRSAFRVVGLYPEIAHSLTVLPGMPAGDEDWLRLQNLAHLPISMYAGGEDTAWVDGARRAESKLGEMGAPDVQLTIVEGAGHVLGTEIVTSVFDRLERARARTENEESAQEDVAIVLDRLHAAAASADGEAYFGTFAPAATFMGTDATERWSLSEFRVFAAPYFERETAWTYTTVERHIKFSPNLQTAWFDERLMNEKYGETRGSGVLLRIGGTWRIAHYVLSFAIPNDAAAAVVELVRETETK